MFPVKDCGFVDKPDRELPTGNPKLPGAVRPGRELPTGNPKLPGAVRPDRGLPTGNPKLPGAVRPDVKDCGLVKSPPKGLEELPANPVRGFGFVNKPGSELPAAVIELPPSGIVGMLPGKGCTDGSVSGDPRGKLPSALEGYSGIDDALPVDDCWPHRKEDGVFL